MKFTNRIALANGKGQSLLTRRFFAVVIDYMVTGMFIGAILSFLYGISFRREPLQTDFYSFYENGYTLFSLALMLAAILFFGLFYYVLIPFKSRSGATLGKMFMGLKLTCEDGSPVSCLRLFFRQFLFLSVFLGLSPVSAYVRQFLSLAVMVELDIFWAEIGMWIAVGCGCWMAVRNKNKALWDAVFSTQVSGKL